jgi:hypothetical protein
LSCSSTNQPTAVTKDGISVTQIRNCGTALETISTFSSTTPWISNNLTLTYTTGITETIATQYTDIFTHNDEVDCPVTECNLYNTGCSSALASANILIESGTPWKITAKRDVKLGYEETLCIKCFGDQPKAEIDSLTIKQVRDCSDHIVALSDQPTGLVLKYDP